MGELSTVVNIGDKLEEQLLSAEITSLRQLQEIGSREAWLRILARDPSACIMRLYALEGATQGIRWHHLSEDVKSSLKDFYHKHKG